MAEANGEQSRQPTNDVAPEHLHLWQIQAVRDVIFIAIAVLLVWAGYAMRAVTVPLLVALLLAYLFEPLVSRLSQHPRLSRPMVVGGLLVTVGATVLAVLAIVVPLLISQTVQLIDDFRAGRFARTALTIREYVPDAYHEEFDRVARLIAPPAVDLEIDQQDEDDAGATEGEADDTGEENTPESDQAGPPVEQAESAQDDIPPAVAAEFESLRQELSNMRAEMQGRAPPTSPEGVGSTGVLEFLRRGVNIVVAVIGEAIAIGLLAFLIPFYFFFFSVWYPKVTKFGSDLIPPDRRERTTSLLKKMDRAVAGFVRGRIVISLIMGVLLAIGWTFVGVQYAVVLGFVIGFFCIVPYLGGVGIPAAIGLLWLGQAGEAESQRMAWYFIILWPTLVFTVVQVFEGYVLTPMIQGKATNLDPVTILVAVLAGGAIMGVYGMLLAIPFAACIKIVFTEVLLPRIKMWSEGRAADPLPIERD